MDANAFRHFRFGSLNVTYFTLSGGNEHHQFVCEVSKRVSPTHRSYSVKTRYAGIEFETSAETLSEIAIKLLHTASMIDENLANGLPAHTGMRVYDDGGLFPPFMSSELWGDWRNKSNKLGWRWVVNR